MLAYAEAKGDEVLSLLFFTSTKVQILIQKELQVEESMFAGGGNDSGGGGTEFT
jgi:hypothetical protein